MQLFEQAKRCRTEHRRNLVALPGAFQHRLGQFLDKKRHPAVRSTISATILGGERRIAGQLVHQRLSVALRQRLQQRLGVLEVSSVKTFGEPAIDRGDEVAGFGAPSLLAPQPGEIADGAQFE